MGKNWREREREREISLEEEGEKKQAKNRKTLQPFP